MQCRRLFSAKPSSFQCNADRPIFATSIGMLFIAQSSALQGRIGMVRTRPHPAWLYLRLKLSILSIFVYPVYKSLSLSIKVYPRAQCPFFAPFPLTQINYESFLKNNPQNIWRVLEKSIPLHSLFGNTPTSTEEKSSLKRFT